MLACCIYLLQALASSVIFLIGILICAIFVCQDDFEHAYVRLGLAYVPLCHGTWAPTGTSNGPMTINCCLISAFVNIQRCLKQAIRQCETKIKGTGWDDLEFLNSSGKRLNNSSCSVQNTIKSSPKTFRTAKNFRAPLSARMARSLNWGRPSLAYVCAAVSV